MGEKMKCPDCEREMIPTEDDNFSGCSWFICECGTEIGTKQANEDILDAYFPDRDKEE